MAPTGRGPSGANGPAAPGGRRAARDGGAGATEASGREAGTSGAAGVEGATVVLGVSGGIAAYKAVEVCRRLTDAGARVVPVLTPAARRFVGAATFSALAAEPARTRLFDEAHPLSHTELGRRADLVVVAPATARLIGEWAHGIGANLLGATLLATRAPVLCCPAMHAEMWEHPGVQENIERLRRFGVEVLEPATGRLAGGDVGVGRLREPEEIVAAAVALYERSRRRGRRLDLAGRRLLVTAGGTREPIDPVRFLGNRSSGRQGHALAEAARRRGASVTLVTASPLAPPPGVEVVRVETAEEMAAAVLSRCEGVDAVVMAAAVADFRPRAVAARKLRRSDGVPEIVLEPTPDVLAGVVARRRPGQVVVGFAAETGGDPATARAKLADKGVDLLVVNDVLAPGAGFEHETNQVAILAADGGCTEVPLAHKLEVADAVLDAVASRLAAAPTVGHPREERGEER